MRGRLEHPAHLTVAALVNRHVHFRRRRAGADHTNLRGLAASVVQTHALEKALHVFALQTSLHDRAIRFLDAVADLPIDGVEEPLAEPSVERLRWLQKRTPFALAIDESLFELGPERVFDLRAARRLVLKPARIGGFGASLRLAERAAAAGMEVVITSVVESAIGVAAAAQLAAALGAGIAHGLATGPWLAEDVAPPLVLSEGFLRLPECPGLGVAPFGHFAQG